MIIPMRKRKHAVQISLRELRYRDGGYFWADTYDGENVVLLGSATEGTNRMETKDADGYQMVKRLSASGRNRTADIRIMYSRKKVRRNLLRRDPTAGHLSRLAGLSERETILTISMRLSREETQAMRENVKTALIAIIGTGSLLIVIVMAVCLYMAFSLSRSFQVAQIQKVTEEVTSSVAQLSSDAEQLLAFVGNDVVASYDMFDEAADAYNQDAGKIDALISDFSATSEELLASIDGVLDAMEGIATATNEGAEGTTDIAQKIVEVKSEGRYVICSTS